MPYTVKLPPIRPRQQDSADAEGVSPLSAKPVTAVTSGFAPGRSAPRPPSPPLTAQTVHTNRGSVGSDLETVGHLLAMPLGVFAREGQLLEVRVPWLTVTLWFAPTDADGERLVQEGISRGRIWTPRELDDLLSCAGGLNADQVKAVALAKLELGGDVVEVHRR